LWFLEISVRCINWGDFLPKKRRTYGATAKHPLTNFVIGSSDFAADIGGVLRRFD
jgi:hypothetical protein